VAAAGLCAGGLAGVFFEAPGHRRDQATLVSGNGLNLFVTTSIPSTRNHVYWTHVAHPATGIMGWRLGWPGRTREIRSYPWASDL
jgi:hypothetical protein